MSSAYERNAVVALWLAAGVIVVALLGLLVYVGLSMASELL